MMRLLRAPLIISTLSLLFFFGVGVVNVQAQNDPGPPACQAAGTCVCTRNVDGRIGTITYSCNQLGTNEIITHQSSLQSYADACKKKAGDSTPPSNNCTVVISTVTTSCHSEALNLGNDWYCEFKAQDGSKITHDPSNTSNGSHDENRDSRGNVVGYTNTNSNGQTTTSGGTQEGAAAVDTNEPGKCTPLNLIPCIMNLPGYFLSAIAYALLVLSTFILFLAGTIFNWVVIRTVFQFAVYFGTSAGMLVAWGVLRDIANIALLFGFIFMGIATILNTQNMEGYSAKKALPRLIIFAVLLNFSLFATQGIIDIANGFGSIFSTYAGQGCEEAANGSQSSEDCANVGISGKITAAAGMNHFPTAEGFQGGFERPYSTAAMLIILSILVSITAMVLFAASIMLIARVVILSILMVTSPIGFAGLAIPSLQKIAKDWWHKLINQAFFAPLYLLMVFISLKLVDGLQEGGASIPDAISGSTASGGSIAGNMQVMVVYAIVIGFMVGSLIISQKMGAAGASFATKTAGGMAFGAQGFVARRTVGRLSGSIANNIRKSPLGETGIGRNLAGFADQGAKASFSSRNLMGNVLKGTGAGLDIGKANKTAAHGYHGIEEKAEKDRLEYAKSLKGSRMEGKKETAEREAKEIESRRTAAATGVTAGEEALEVAQAGVTEAEAAIVTANAGVATAETAITEALAAQATAKQHLEAREFALAEQRAGDPRDPAVQQALRQDEEAAKRAREEYAQATAAVGATQSNLQGAKNAVTTAEEGLTRAQEGVDAATTRLATARTEQEAAAAAVPAGVAKEINEKTRRENFANSMLNEKHLGFTAAKHANHAAAGKILKDANKDDFEKALDVLKADRKKQKEESRNEEPEHEEHPPTNNNNPPPSDHPH